MHKQPKHTKITVAIFGALALMSGSVAMAASLTVTDFVPGTAATAADVNSKFAEVETAVNDNDARVTTNTGNISTNTGNIGSNTTAIGTNTTNVSINASDIGANVTAIGGHEARITTLESAGAGGGETSADNAPISVDCATQSLQAAIEAAPLHGRTEITISGACADDIFIRRSGITIQGLTGPGTDSITGNLSGFTSDPADNFNLPAGGGALVQRTLSAAVEMSDRARVVLKNMTINAGTNATSVKAMRNTSIKLSNVTLSGGQNGFGLHLSNSDAIVTGVTATGNGAGAASLFAGSAVFADLNSVLEIQDGNTFTGGDADTGGLVALSNTSVRLTGANNIINAGNVIAANEPIGLELAMNSTFIQPVPGAGNQINGDVVFSTGSRAFMQSMAISSDFMEIFESSSVTLEPSSSGAIAITITGGFELGSGGSLDMGDGGLPVTISGPSLPMRLLDHSTILLFGGSQINMDVQLFRGSSIDGGDNAKINGTLEVHGFSGFVVTGQDTTPAVTGGTTCFAGEAFKFTTLASFTAVDLCTTAE